MRAQTQRPWLKWVIAGTAFAIVGAVYYQYSDLLTLQSLADREQSLREYRQSHPLLVYAIALVLYVAVTGFSLPGAAVMTLAFGWYFGFARALVLVSFASTAGATIAFLMSRYLLRDSVQNRFGKRLQSFNENLEREGAFYLFTLRLIPAVPFFVINVVMGLTPMKTRTFWWVSQLGMLPGTIAYVYAGSTFPSLQAIADHGVGGILSWPLILAFAVLGVLPLAGKWVVNTIRRRQNIGSTAAA